ncbi:hypothetical protein [Chryseobacterium hagamense]|uniref:hypothetical protein n=1 Tax=Chryseobacterium hagamense TaxID=395935 RepID=UPI0011BE5998|nr:hypothetical protein [Chryseobacterium hagamense]
MFIDPQRKGQEIRASLFRKGHPDLSRLRSSEKELSHILLPASATSCDPVGSRTGKKMNEKRGVGYDHRSPTDLLQTGSTVILCA